MAGNVGGDTCFGADALVRIYRLQKRQMASKRVVQSSPKRALGRQVLSRPYLRQCEQHACGDRLDLLDLLDRRAAPERPPLGDHYLPYHSGPQPLRG